MLHIKSALHSLRIYAAPVAASQIGKQCKPVQVHSFSRIVLWTILRKFACWGDPQSPRTSSADDGYAAKLLTISGENICTKMLCDDGDGCDDETESEPGAICIVTIVTTVTLR